MVARMSLDTQLFLLRAVHTVYFALNVAGIFYTLWCGLTNRRGPLLWASIVLSAATGLALILNDCECLFRTVAVALTGDRKVSDILLPGWIASRIVLVFTPITLAGYALVGWRLATRRKT